MDNLIASLFAARDIAHKFHLKTKKFSAHLALGDLYDALVLLADGLSEASQGKYGIMDLDNAEVQEFSTDDAVKFIGELAAWAEESRKAIAEEDTYLQNEWDTVLKTVYVAKYKLENLA